MIRVNRENEGRKRITGKEGNWREVPSLQSKKKHTIKLVK